MRPDVSTFGILACLTGLAVGEDGDEYLDAADVTGELGGTSTTGSRSNSVILVGPLQDPAVYPPSSFNQTISFSRGRGITELDVRAVALKRYKDNFTVANGIRDSYIPDENLPDKFRVTQRDTLSDSASRTFLMNNSSVSLVLAEDVTIVYGNSLNQPLYYEFQWQNSTSRGTSYSQLLAVFYNDRSLAIQNLRATGKESEPAFAENIEESPGGLGSSSTTTPSTPTSSPEPPSELTAQPVAGSSSNHNDDHGASTSNHRLSTGAIAGISVGCAVAGLLAIAFLVWFCFFRRRRRRNNQRRSRAGFAARNHPSGSHAMIAADKEAVGISDSSPRSAYPPDDDSGRLRDPPGSNLARGGGVGGAVANDDNDSAAFVAPPYAEHHRGTSSSPSPALPPPYAVAAAAAGSQSDLGGSVGRPSTATRAATPPFASRYAHLIEEGMTEEEIRRLEEEERHLDAAIEGRNSRAAHQS